MFKMSEPGDICKGELPGPITSWKEKHVLGNRVGRVEPSKSYGIKSQMLDTELVQYFLTMPSLPFCNGNTCSIEMNVRNR